MSQDHSLSATREVRLPLQRFLKNSHELLVRDPGHFLRPLLDCLDEFHQAGNAHGAITPGRLLVSPDGALDLGFFKAQAGSRDDTEALTYYPDGLGEPLEERQQRDLEALGAVLYFIVADQPPASRERRAGKLAGHALAKAWPTDFIALVDRLLDGGIHLPSLKELSASLATPVPPVTPPAQVAVTPPPETKPVPPPEPSPPRIPAMRLPNAMVGREFSAEILPFLGKDLPELGIVQAISGLPAGLEISGGVLRGIPRSSGEFEARLRCHPTTTVAGKPRYFERNVALTVNPDPRSLWKNIASDQTAPYWKPDEATAFLVDGPLAVAGASLRGRSHAHVGSFRDDDMAMAWFPESRWYSLTVADGAGSSKFSREGSRLACESVKGYFAKYFANPENALTRLVTANPDDSAIRTELYQQFGTSALQARKVLEDEAAARNAVSRDFHTTLITALLHPLANGRWFVAAFSIGDGAAALVAVPGGAPCLLTQPDGGEFAGQTVFLTMKEALASGEAIMARISTHVVPDFDALLLVTDGISDPRFDSETRLAEPAAWSGLWQEIRTTTRDSHSPEGAAAAILEWMNFHSPGHHDDRTLVLATAPATFPPS